MWKLRYPRLPFKEDQTGEIFFTGFDFFFSNVNARRKGYTHSVIETSMGLILSRDDYINQNLILRRVVISRQ